MSNFNSTTLLQNCLSSCGSCSIVLGDESFLISSQNDEKKVYTVILPTSEPSLAQGSSSDGKVLTILTSKHVLAYNIQQLPPILVSTFTLPYSAAPKTIAVSSSPYTPKHSNSSYYLIAVGGGNGVFLYTLEATEDTHEAWSMTLDKRILSHIPICSLAISSQFIAIATLDSKIFITSYLLSMTEHHEAKSPEVAVQVIHIHIYKTYILNTNPHTKLIFPPLNNLISPLFMTHQFVQCFECEC